MLSFSQSADNNKEAIAAVLGTAFADVSCVLEIGSGTGQHAVHFAREMPHLQWQPSDRPEQIVGIQERLALEGAGNILPPVVLDVAQYPWAIDSVDAVYSANCVHIMSWQHVEHLFRGVGKVLDEGGLMCLYGPFKYDGAFTTESNARFDLSLRMRDPLSGVRDFEAVDALARQEGMELVADHAMPANNQLLVWRRQ